MTQPFSFSIYSRDSQTRARTGVIKTPHGTIETPAFIPVGTQATVKSLTPEEITTVGTQMFFVNTYHMAMRPGIDTVQRLGGLHAFMKWNGPIITDSGGFQVFSLSREEGEQTLVKITEDGVQFRSHWDGSYHLFTPEASMEYQWKLGSDIHIAFDDCTPNGVSYEQAKTSMERTHRWAKRSVAAHNTFGKQYSQQPYQALYGSVQGSIYQDLREQSAKFISSLDTDGIAVGGVSVGESKQDMYNVIAWVTPLLPEQKPRHLLGVGEIDDIFQAVKQGIDTFDCVQATRLARTGYLYSTQNLNGTLQSFVVNISKSIYQEDVNPIDATCLCYTCQKFSRAYVHHLFKVRELLGYRLATIHNLTFLHSLVSTIRQAIVNGTLLELEKQWLLR